MKDTVPAARWRALGFVALSVVCLSVAVGYVLNANSRHRALTQAATASTAAPESVAAVQAQPHAVFRNLSTAAEAGFVALAPLGAPGGPRQITDYACRRVHMAAGHGLCLAEQQDALGSAYRARIFGADLRTIHELPLAGLPSRARVSPDGRLGASTVFVNGDSYAVTGAFSTRTSIYDMSAGTSLGDLETFAASKDGKRFESVDFNYWGVTFTHQAGRFYATLGTGGHTYLVEGDVAARTVNVLRDGVECPSLSPDGKRIAFKQKAGGGLLEVKWRLSVLALDTLADHPLAETRNVDDQAEWLDDGTVLYSVESDIYAVPADGTGTPRLFTSRADSPSVVAGGAARAH